MANFTLGPWTWESDNNRLYAEGDYTVLEATLEGTMYFGDYPDKAEANRQLIRAATEMYEALLVIKGHLDADDPNNYRADDPEGAMDTAFERARAAIAKADGSPR